MVRNPETSPAMSADYELGADLWRSGPELVYRRFARALVREAPVRLTGLRVLDLGAGTGAVSTELRAAGASPVAVDSSEAMIRIARRDHEGLEAAVADVFRLPFADATFDGSFAGFLLNHMKHPHLALVEAARVTRSEGLLMTTTFAEGDDHPAKRTVEMVAANWGWEAPSWYRAQTRWAKQTDTPEGLERQARRAGLVVADVLNVRVDAGPVGAKELVLWRLGHAHMAAFTSKLNDRDLSRLMIEAETAIGPGNHCLRRQLLILSIRVPA
jgi:ubiquinone/menaquinone biosynthesis C-methylase UbiE